MGRRCNPKRAVIVPFGSKANGGYTWTVRRYVHGVIQPSYTSSGYWRKEEAIRAARKAGFVVVKSERLAKQGC